MRAIVQDKFGPLVARLMGVGLTKPNARVAGINAAEVVEAIGADVRQQQPGDEVLARGKIVVTAA